MGRQIKKGENMKTCEHCHRKFIQSVVDEMLEAMGFGHKGEDTEEDYLVLIYGLCPACWPDFH